MQQLDSMTRLAVLGTLRSAVDVGAGPTPEQTHLLSAVATHVLDVADDVEAPPLDAADAAGALGSPTVRRFVCEGLVVLELSAHPTSAEQVDRIDGYLAALGLDEANKRVLRDAIARDRDHIAADWARTQGPPTLEPSVDAGDAAELRRRCEALAGCPAGSLGRGFHDFSERHGFALPVEHPSLISHDFAHVIAGYEPVPEGELALQAFLFAATRATVHGAGLLASLLLYEVGLLDINGLVPREAVLDRPGAAELFADAVARGLATPELDLQALDHLALADRDVVELRLELGVPAPLDGPFTFVP